MSDLEKNIEQDEVKQIVKTASRRERFNVRFLQSTLSNEILKLVELQSHTVDLLDEIIESLKKKPLHGGSE